MNYIFTAPNRSQGRVQKVRLSEKAYHQIKEWIFTLRLPPSGQVDDGLLERELSIGRTPIREALLRLAAEDLIEIVPGRGYFVRPVNIDDVQALFEAMMISERAAAALAARRITREQVQRLHQINADLKAALAGRDFVGMTLRNSRLHRLVYEAAHNVFIESSLNHIQNQAQRLAYLCYSHEPERSVPEGYFDLINRDHDDLISALEAGAEGEAVAVMTRHIQLFHSRIAMFTSPPLEGLDLLLPGKTEAA